MRVAWLAPYPVSLLREKLVLRREGRSGHACSWILNLSRALAEQNDIDLHLLTLTAWVPYSQSVKVGNINFHVLKNGIPLINRGYPPSFPLDVFSGFAGDARKLARQVAAIQPDIVHAHGTEAAYARGALQSGCPSLVSIQGIITEYQKTNPSFRYFIHSKWERREIRRGKYFGCRTGFDTDFVRRVNPRAKIFQLQEAMDPIFFSQEWQPGDSGGILFVGSLDERKGVAFLVEAFGMVKQQIPGATLTLIGQGSRDYTEKLRARAQGLGVANDLLFRGRLTAEEIAREHLRAQVFVLPTLNDNSPNTLAEAMVSGMPVVASNVGGIPAMVTHGETGILVPSRDAKTLAEKIVRLLGDKAERGRLGSNARTAAQAKHEPRRVAAETRAAYAEILRLERGTDAAIPA